MYHVDQKEKCVVNRHSEIRWISKTQNKLVHQHCVLYIPTKVRDGRTQGTEIGFHFQKMD